MLNSRIFHFFRMDNKEPKFIVFYSMLMSLFSLFCFKCRAGFPKVDIKTCGTMAIVQQCCKSCGGMYTWRSQPLVLGRYPAGNILLSFGILMSGSLISKVMLLFRHMGLKAYNARTYFYHQKQFMFPLVLQFWQKSLSALVSQLNTIKDGIWAGDGRFDSTGHSAKYGCYTMLNCNLTKIVHFELLQVYT
jgi:solute carrier family 8 (sodium/calcium exchanger)